MYLTLSGSVGNYKNNRLKVRSCNSFYAWRFYPLIVTNIYNYTIVLIVIPQTINSCHAYYSLEVRSKFEVSACIALRDFGSPFARSVSSS